MRGREEESLAINFCVRWDHESSLTVGDDVMRRITQSTCFGIRSLTQVGGMVARKTGVDSVFFNNFLTVTSGVCHQIFTFLEASTFFVFDRVG